ncbi:MAG: 2Fe-2S iron-sulfur cluster-binding protein, partial [Marinilabilia sp.]
MNIVKLTIDNKPVVVEKGTTLLEAAKSIGIKVPSL